MNKPPLSLLALLLTAPLLTGGCTLYANPSACKAEMRQAAANITPHQKLSISHVGVGIDGSHVVVEGTLESAAAPADASVPKPVAKRAKKPAETPAALECTFDGDKLKTLRWLAPPEFANPPSPAPTNG